LGSLTYVGWSFFCNVVLLGFCFRFCFFYRKKKERERERKKKILLLEAYRLAIA